MPETAKDEEENCDGKINKEIMERGIREEEAGVSYRNR